jgi:hypothetical protein
MVGATDRLFNPRVPGLNSSLSKIHEHPLKVTPIDGSKANRETRLPIFIESRTSDLFLTHFILEVPTWSVVFSGASNRAK